MSDINDNTCFEAARKCVYLYEFENIYNNAIKNNLLKNYIWLKNKKKGNIFKFKWNYNVCYKEAKKYDCRSKFEKYSPGAYSYAKKHNYLNEYTWMPIPKRYTYEDVYNIAK